MRVRGLTLMLIDSLLLLFSFAVMPDHIYIYPPWPSRDVGKHVMRICHTDYDQHTGNDYCLIVALWSNGQTQDFLIQFKSTKRNGKKNNQLQCEWETGKKHPPATKVSWHFFLFLGSFFSGGKKVLPEILTSHCGCSSIETGRTVCQSDHYDCWGFVPLSLKWNVTHTFFVEYVCLKLVI